MTSDSWQGTRLY